MKALMAIGLFVIFWCFAIHSVVVCTPPVRPGTGNPSPRLPRTSASQLSQLNGTGTKSPSSRNPYRNGNLRIREQQLLNVFEVVVSTLEGKLQRIDNLDKAVEHLMRRVEQLDNRVGDNIHKAESVISKLRNLDNKISVDPNSHVDALNGAASEIIGGATSNGSKVKISANVLDSRLVALDRKVSDIDSKLEGRKSQIDNNFLAVDDIGAEASEKKPISMNVLEITKNMNAEVISHVSNELGDLRSTTESMDKKLQFHINIVSENIGRVLKMIGDIHDAVVDHHVDPHFYPHNVTTTPAPLIKSSKIAALVKQIKQIMSVSEKMDEVWDVVVGTKTSVDDLVPKSNELLTQTQRQERAIGEIHHYLKAKANLIISNLNVVEKRLKKQENDVAVLAQRPVPAELLMDPTIDRLVEYDPNSRYSLIEEYTEPPSIPTTTAPIVVQTSQTSQTSNQTTSTTSSSTSSSSSQNTVQSNTIQSNAGTNKSTSRKGGIIFPSVKNKPSVGNSTFTTDILSFKDVKVCTTGPLLMDPTIDRLVEYDPNSRYSLIEEYTEPPSIPTTTAPIVVQTSQTSQTSNQTTSTTSSSTSSSSSQNTVQSNTIQSNAGTNKSTSRKGGIIFPSVKNKPSVGNSTFTTDILSFKDVKDSEQIQKNIRIGQHGQQSEQELATKMLQIQSKRFYLDVKQNRRGRFIKVAEIGADGRRSQIFLALSTAAEFRDHLSTFSDYYSSLGPPNPENVPEDGKLKSEMMIKDNRRYYLDLKENTRGRFLRVSQTITRGGPRSQIASPAQGMIEFRDALTDLLEEFGTNDGGFKGELPEGRHMKVQNKNFYFDIGQNNRGIYMRISEVKSNFRTAITVPENCWSRFRDILSDYCDKMKKSSDIAAITADNTLQTTSSNSN